MNTRLQSDMDTREDTNKNNTPSSGKAKVGRPLPMLIVRDNQNKKLQESGYGIGIDHQNDKSPPFLLTVHSVMLVKIHKKTHPRRLKISRQNEKKKPETEGSQD